MSLALTIFTLVFFTELVSWIGKAVLLNIFYTIHQYLFNRPAIQRQRQLKKEILTTKQELLQTSAQDQFAKWAKLRRKVDKGLDDLEKLNNELSSSKASYSTKFSTVIWLLTSGAQYGVGWWFGKQAVFYLPPGWFGPAQWWLALPFAPMGSVSCGVWQMACKRVIKVGEGIVKDFVVPPRTTAPVSAAPPADDKAARSDKTKTSAEKTE
ncbi:hypothetical protein K439DRAFT_1633221 [Ramaria rubella]|nr:hypothetical protein K439DRAFT_1633221 [Ramaria rubella]